MEKIFSTSIFHAPFIKDVDSLMKSQSKVYQFMFSYQGSMTLSDIFRLPLHKLMVNFSGRHMGFKAYQKKLGACHGDDLLYIFPFDPTLFPKALKTEVDKKISKQMVALILNMVHQGNPTPLINVDLNGDEDNKRENLSEEVIEDVCWNPIKY